MKTVKLVYIVSEIEKSLAFEWIARSIDRNKFDLSFILLGNPNSALAFELRKLNVHVLELPLGGKLTILRSFWLVVKSLLKIKPEIIHTHLFYANLIGLSAGWLLNVPKRVMTRHHAMIHYNEYRSGLKWDKYCNRIATHVVAISQNTKQILTDLDKVDSKKIRTIWHGFDLNYFLNVKEEEVQKLKEKYGLGAKGPIIGVISRYLKWKGIDYTIAAFEELLIDFPNAHLVIANANGNYKTEIRMLLSKLPHETFTEIEFENNLAPLYRVFDVYVHVPIDAQSEAFGQTYIETLASGVPSVFTLSGIAGEFIRDEYNSLVVQYRDAKSIYSATKRILSESELRASLIKNGKLSANLFSIERMIESLTALYEE